jgi:GH18 family chitinase
VKLDFAVENELAGIMWWAMDLDDYNFGSKLKERLIQYIIYYDSYSSIFMIIVH